MSDGLLAHRGFFVFRERSARMGTDRGTVQSYDSVAAEYAAEAAAMPEWVATEIDAFVTELGGSGRVLEIGSGGGRDALELEKRGISVRRTDISKGFVELLRECGFEADLLDPLTEDLADPQRPGTPYDGVWACACLIHVTREDFGTVVGRLAEATRTGGRLHASVREGDGEEVSTHGNARRYVETHWREPALRSALTGAGWIVNEVRRCIGRPDDRWLSVRASRA
jgi:SAM-dependent methyltransferase